MEQLTAEMFVGFYCRLTPCPVEPSSFSIHFEVEKVRLDRPTKAMCWGHHHSNRLSAIMMFFAFSYALAREGERGKKKKVLSESDSWPWALM